MKQLLIKGDKIQEVNHEDILDLFNSDIRNLVRDLSNYRPVEDYFEKNLLKCVLCETMIENPSSPDHLILWTQDNMHYICFHFRCGCKEGTANAVNELLKRGEFDSIAPIRR